MADTIAQNSLSLDAAQRILEACIKKSEEMGVPVNIVISDPAGEPILSARMDKSPRLSAELARNKAYTVTAFNGMPTHLWWPAIEGDPALAHGIPTVPRVVVFGGGVPVRIDGALVGAVGVSGGSADQDRVIAEAGAALFS